ncbi:MAG: hypothetical protein PHW73_00500 [Atribacterota bacterium]|nr:hypothetical protein [Atribacterota bacterium]
MEYKGKLYGKVGNYYIPLENTTDDFEDLQKRLDELLECLDLVLGSFALEKCEKFELLEKCKKVIKHIESSKGN